MNQLLNLISRPQFASLCSLTPPDKVQSRMGAFQQTAKACPMLVGIDIGYSMWSNMKPDDNSLLKLPSNFPYISKIRLNMERITDSGIATFCKSMGGRLRSISIRDCFRCNRPLSDDTLRIIACHCTNLEHFNYQYSSLSLSHCVIDEGKLVSDAGILELLKCCSKLKTMSLIKAPNGITSAVFEHLAAAYGDKSATTVAVKLNRLLLMDVNAVSRNKFLCAKLAEKVESIKVISVEEHNDRIAKLRSAHQCHLYWEKYTF